MTLMLTCDCPSPTSDCTLQQELKDALVADGAFGGIQAYTGGLATKADTASTGPTIPYIVINELPANNSTPAGENLTRHEVVVTLDIYTRTDKQGSLLAKEARRVIRTAGQIDTRDGYACQVRNPARPQQRKAANEIWRTRQNATFTVLQKNDE